jgi:hypothetical protein
MQKLFFTALLFICCYAGLSAQEKPPEFVPKISGYIGIVHPIVTFGAARPVYNFTDFYLVGMTTAVIVRKHPKYAYSLEIVSFVRAQDGTSKVGNLMVHPGVTFFGKNNFAITPRFGFESAGRYGPTLVLTKKMVQLGPHLLNFNFVNLLRFGNSAKASYTVAINLTCGF